MASSGLELKLIFGAAGMGGVTAAFGSVTDRMNNLTKASVATVDRMNKAGLSILDTFAKQKTALGALSSKIQEHESQMAKMAKSVKDAKKNQEEATEALVKYRNELGTAKRTDEQRAEVEKLRKASVEAAQASKDLSQKFDEQRVKGKQLKEEFIQQNRQVQQLRDEMRKAGINTAKLGEERGRLRKLMEQEQATLSKLTSKYERLAAVQRDVGKYRQEFNDRKMNVVAAAGVAASLAVPVVAAASYEDRVKQISITGELYKEKGAEESLSGKIRQAATKYGVSHENVTAGVDKLVAQGMNANVAGNYAGMLAKTAKATRADMGDLAELVYTLQTKFKLKTEGEIFEAINVLAKAGKLGSYEIKAMAKAFPELGGAAASFGSTGMQGVKEMGALMQTMRAGAGSAGEAETYMRNWFSHMSAATTRKSFESVGIDYEKSKLAKVTEGKGKVSNVEASFMVFDDYINKVVSSGQVKTYDKKGKLKSSADIKHELKVAFEQAKKDGLQGEAMQQFMQSAIARVGLSSVVQDMQATQAYLAWMTGKDKYQETRVELDKAGVKNTVDNDFIEQNKLLTQQWENLKASVVDLSITVGKVLSPALTDLFGTLSVVVGYVNTFAQENPKLASGLIVVAGGIAAFTSVLLALGAAASLARLSLAAARGLPLIGGALGNTSGIAAAVKPAATGSGVLSKLAAGVKGIKDALNNSVIC